MIRALIGKELAHHGVALAGALGVVAAITVVMWSSAFIDNVVSLLASAQWVAFLVLPLFALYTAERLVVQDHDAGTHEFLAALPIRPIARVAVRYTLGLLATWTAGAGVLLATAALASRREGVPLVPLLQLGLAFGAYLFAWWGTAFGVAHVGRARWLVWWLVFCGAALAQAYVEDPFGDWLWAGVLSVEPDRMRLAFPWARLPLAAGWGVFGLALGAFVSTWRGGALLDRGFRPATGHQRARYVGYGLAASFASSFVGERAAPDVWTEIPALPARAATVRAVGDEMEGLGAAVSTALDALAERFPVDRWPPVVLVRGRSMPEEAPVWSSGSVDPTVTRQILVDPREPQARLVARVVGEVLAHRLAGLADWDPGARLVLDGLSRAAVPDPEGRRLAALGRGRAEEALVDYHALVRAIGPDAAAQVAGAGIDALREVGGDDAVSRLGAALFSPRWETDWPSGRALRTAAADLASAAAVDRAEWVRRWEASLAGLVGPAAEAGPPLSLAVRDGVWVVGFDRAAAGAQLEWLALDPLVARPLPEDAGKLVRPLPDATELALPPSDRERVAVRWVRATPLGRVASPWTYSSSPRRGGAP